MSAATIGLVVLALAETPAVMASYLPSPSTAYKDGANPKRREWLKRHAIEGSIVALAIAGAATLLAWPDYGSGAILIFIAAAGILGTFLWEYSYAVSCGAKEGHRYRA